MPGDFLFSAQHNRISAGLSEADCSHHKHADAGREPIPRTAERTHSAATISSVISIVTKTARHTEIAAATWVAGVAVS